MAETRQDNGAKELETLTLFLLLWIESTILLAVLLSTVTPVGPRILIDDRVISMSFDMFLEILRPLEGLSTEVASVRLQGYVNSNVRGDVIAFDDRYTTATPSASEIEVISALASDVGLADMIL